MTEPLPIPEDWKYVVIRGHWGPYEEHALTDPSGNRHYMWTSSLDFWSNPRGYMQRIHKWVVDTIKEVQSDERQ